MLKQMMDLEDLETLPLCGFVDHMRVIDLQDSCDSVQTCKGIYLVARDDLQSVVFLEKSTGGHFKGKDPSVPISKLVQHWLDGPKVLYAGETGSGGSGGTLRSRLRLLMNFSLGQPCGHWGGRLLWQLANSKNLLVYWQATPEKEPKAMKTEILGEFKQKYGRLPFANLKK